MQRGRTSSLSVGGAVAGVLAVMPLACAHGVETFEEIPTGTETAGIGGAFGAGTGTAAGGRPSTGTAGSTPGTGGSSSTSASGTSTGETGSGGAGGTGTSGQGGAATAATATTGAGGSAGTGGTGGAGGAAGGDAGGRQMDAGVEAAGGAPGHDAAAPDAAGGIADAAPDTGAICPTSITVTGQNETPGHGGQSLNDVLYTDSCPQGQVVVGYTGLVDSLAPASIGTVATVCGKLSINATGGCQITVTTGSSLPERGVYGDTEFRQLCPANQVVVGFQGRESAQLLNQVGFVCAPLVISRGAAGNTITLGPTTALTRAGGTAGTTYSESCPAGQIARGTNVTIAMGIVDAFGLICAPPVAR